MAVLEVALHLEKTKYSPHERFSTVPNVVNLTMDRPGRGASLYEPNGQISCQRRRVDGEDAERTRANPDEPVQADGRGKESQYRYRTGWLIGRISTAPVISGCRYA